MRHLDLFSGIGGFAYAMDQVWQSVTHEFVEIDPFCKAVLRKHWPQFTIHDDVKTYIPERGSADIITGGVPCQPASVAGQQRGHEDARWLWPETLAIVAAVRPRYAVLENVPNLVNLDAGMAFEDILSLLDDEGYEIIPLNLPAAGIGAPHLRERIWIVAHDTRDRSGRRPVSIQPEEKRRSRASTHPIGTPRKPSDAQGVGREEGFVELPRRIRQPASLGDSGIDAYTKRIGRQQGIGKIGIQQEIAQAERPSGRSACARNAWSEEWPQAVTRLCALDDGLPRRLVRLPDGTKISGPKWRNESIKAAGNAIVPQVAIEIMRAIKAYDDSMDTIF